MFAPVRHRPPGPRTCRLRVDELPTRIVPSTSPVTVSAGVLVIRGTPDDDIVRILTDPADSSRLGVVFNGQVAIFDHDLTPIRLIQFFGGSGNDTFANNSNVHCRAYGGDGNDILIGGSASDLLVGGPGDDDLDGQGGDDSIVGGLGDDALTGGDGNDVLVAGDGDDNLDGGLGDDSLSGGVGDDELDAGDGNDTLDAGPGADGLAGGDGNDRLAAGPGDDFLDAGPGDDTLLGGDGNDFLDSGDGNDVLVGGAGDDEMDGGAGDDRLSGGGDDDLLTGGDGADTLIGGSGADGLDGGNGNDRLDGGAGADQLDGGAGDDTAAGGTGDDSVRGGFGNDSLDGGSGADTVLGGLGDDWCAGGPSLDVVDGGAGRNTVLGGDIPPQPGGWAVLTDRLGTAVGRASVDTVLQDGQPTAIVAVELAGAVPDTSYDVILDPDGPGPADPVLLAALQTDEIGYANLTVAAQADLGPVQLGAAVIELTDGATADLTGRVISTTETVLTVELAAPAGGTGIGASVVLSGELMVQVIGMDPSAHYTVHLNRADSGEFVVGTFTADPDGTGSLDIVGGLPALAPGDSLSVTNDLGTVVLAGTFGLGGEL